MHLISAPQPMQRNLSARVNPLEHTAAGQQHPTMLAHDSYNRFCAHARRSRIAIENMPVECLAPGTIQAERENAQVTR